MSRLLVLVCLMLTGCGLGATVEPGHVAECRNTITGEDWTVHSENVRDAVVGIGRSCATETADNGRTYRLCDDDPVVKCWSVQ